MTNQNPYSQKKETKMAFVETNKSLDDILLGTHTDYIHAWATVHDEVDFTVPTALSAPIMKQITATCSLKELLDKFQLPGVAMSYDVEFDKYGSWTASSSVDVYQYPLNHIHSEYLSELKDIKTKLHEKTDTNPNQEAVSPKQNIVTIPYDKVTEQLLLQIQTLPDGFDTVIVSHPDGTQFQFNRSVNTSTLKLD